MHDFFTQTGAEWAALGSFGGIARVLVALLKKETMPTPMKILWLFIANALVSGFSGYMGAVAASAVSPNDSIHVIAAGVFGWLGVTGLELLADKLKGKMNL